MKRVRVITPAEKSPAMQQLYETLTKGGTKYIPREKPVYIVVPDDDPRAVESEPVAPEQQELVGEAAEQDSAPKKAWWDVN